MRTTLPGLVQLGKPQWYFVPFSDLAPSFIPWLCSKFLWSYAFRTWPAKPSASCSLAWMLKETFLLVCSLVIFVTISRVPSSDISFFSRNFCTATNLGFNTCHLTYNQIKPMKGCSSEDFQLSMSRVWIQLLQWQTFENPSHPQTPAPSWEHSRWGALRQRPGMWRPLLRCAEARWICSPGKCWRGSCCLLCHWGTPSKHIRLDARYINSTKATLREAHCPPRKNSSLIIFSPTLNCAGFRH